MIIKSTSNSLIKKVGDHVEKIKYASTNLSKNEFVTLCIIDHPNIIKTYGYNKKSGVLSLEYIDGVCMQEYLMNNHLTEYQIFIIFEQMISAVNYCHQHNIVHRDIKLENFMIDKNNIVKLIDFEYAIKFTSSDDTLTINHVSGTPIYLPPELAKKIDNDKYPGVKIVSFTNSSDTPNIYDKNKPLTYHSKLGDVWCLGIVLYELVFREHPYDKNYYTIDHLVDDILHLDINFWLGTENSLKTLLQGMLHKKPEYRFTLNQVITSKWFKKFNRKKLFYNLRMLKYNKYIVIKNNKYKKCKKIDDKQINDDMH